MLQTQSIDSFACGSGTSRKSLYNNEILRTGVGESCLSENLYEPVRDRAALIVAGGISITSVTALAFYQLKFAYVS